MRRHENQPKNQIVLSLEVVLGGIGQTGLAATTLFELQRRSDGLFFDLTSGLWQVGPGGGTNILAEVSAANFPGLYEFVVPGTGLTADDLLLATGGYRFIVQETNNSITEMGLIDVGPVKGGEWDELEEAHTTAASMGEDLIRMLRLRQSNQRVVATAWDPVTRQPTAGEVLTYDDKATLLADTGPGFAAATGRYTFVATFDASGQMTGYTSVKDA